MFLNLHAARNNKRLALNNQIPRQKSYLSSLGRINKQKSYSTSSLRQQFEEFKHLKNKSLSHANSHNIINRNVRSFNNSPLNKQKKQLYQHPTQFNKPDSNLRAKQFKKSYLNLDTRLNKCTIPKDYFKSIPSVAQLAKQSHRFIQPQRQTLERSNHYIANKNPQNQHQNSYFKQQVQRRLQQQDRRRSIAMMDEIKQLRNINQLLKLQNQELRKQRNVDLNIIARQNQVMQQQEQLLNSKDDEIQRLKLNYEHQQPQKDSNAYTFHKARKESYRFLNKIHECQQCNKRNSSKKLETQFQQLRAQKFEQQKKLMKKQIHELVYQCQKYKQSMKRMQQKYQKQLQQNQKLIKLIYQEDASSQLSSTQKKQNFPKSNPADRQPYLNLNMKNNNYDRHQPTSIKGVNTYQYDCRPDKYPLMNSPKQSVSQKLKSSKSGSSLIKFIDDPIYNSQYIAQYPCQNNRRKEDQLFQRRRSQKAFQERNHQRIKQTEWCQNSNIKKYLEQINRQKQKEFKQIQKLLKL